MCATENSVNGDSKTFRDPGIVNEDGDGNVALNATHDAKQDASS